MDQRREYNVEQRDTTRAPDGRISYRHYLLATLREREVVRVGTEMVQSKGLPFCTATDGENVSGKFTRTVQLSSGKFAVVEKSPLIHICPVAAGYRPSARPRGYGHRAERIRVVAVGAANVDRLVTMESLANQISVCLSIGMIQNDIFKALSDPTRRAIFEKLASGSMNAVTLRQGMEISQPAMSQHLSVLRNAKLVREERQGRFVNYEVNPEGLALIAEWLAKYRTYWPARIDALNNLLKDMDQ